MPTLPIPRSEKTAHEASARWKFPPSVFRWLSVSQAGESLGITRSDARYAALSPVLASAPRGCRLPARSAGGGRVASSPGRREGVSRMTISLQHRAAVRSPDGRAARRSRSRGRCACRQRSRAAAVLVGTQGRPQRDRRRATSVTLALPLAARRDLRLDRAGLAKITSSPARPASAIRRRPGPTS